MALLGEIEAADGVGRHSLTHRFLEGLTRFVPAFGPGEGDPLVPMRKVPVTHPVEANVRVFTRVRSDREVEGLRGLGPTAGVQVLDPLEIGVLPVLSPGGKPGE